MTATTRRMLISAMCACFAAAAFAPTASAADVGNRCVANNGGAGTFLQTGNPATLATYVVPAGGGIITKWGSNVIAYGTGITARLKLVRPGAVAGSFSVVGETALEAVQGGNNEFATHLNVTGGEQIAMWSSVDSLYCSSPDATNTLTAGTTAAEPAVGSTFSTSGSGTGLNLALYAVVEPDADKDGYGDESEDLCPASAAVHATPCPIVKLSKYALPPTKKSVQIAVTSNTPAPVTISGGTSIKLPKSGKKKAHTVKFKFNSPTTTVSPGAITTITTNLPVSLVKALKLFPASKKFTLSLTISGVGIANTDTSVVTVKLSGTKK